MKLFPDELLSSLGILDWGYTEESVPRTFSKYEKWVDQNFSAPLSYLSDHRKALRKDIKSIYPSFQSATVFLFSYKETKKWLLENNQHAVASYTLGYGGEDYHSALKYRLQILGEHLKLQAPDLEFTLSLDIQPVLERDLAHRAGLGWFGKNSMLINRKDGSYFIIGSLLLNQKLALPKAEEDVDHCGTCTACADACPTNAINLESRTLIASQCISTFTIEVFKDAPAPTGFENSRGEIFGCDICQDVCPWNKKTLLPVQAKLFLKEKFIFLKELFFDKNKTQLQVQLESDTNRGFKKKLHGTAFDRPGREGWLKNLKAHFISNRNDL